MAAYCGPTEAPVSNINYLGSKYLPNRLSRFSFFMPSQVHISQKFCDLVT